MKNEIKVILARMYEYVQDAISICNEENNDYKKLLLKTRIIKHWAGIDSRGVSQWNGKVFDELLETHYNNISDLEAVRFLNNCLENEK